MENVNGGQLSYGKDAQIATAMELELNTENCVGYLKKRSFYRDGFVKAVIDMFLENRKNLGMEVINEYMAPVPKKDELSNEDFKRKMSSLKQILEA